MNNDQTVSTVVMRPVQQSERIHILDILRGFAIFGNLAGFASPAFLPGYAPHGYLPEKVENTRLEPHEALMVLNTGSEPARIELDFYFEDREPVKGGSLPRVLRCGPIRLP